MRKKTKQIAASALCMLGILLFGCSESDTDGSNRSAVFTEVEMLEMQEILADEGVAKEIRKYCVGEVTEAIGFDPKGPRAACKDSDCKNQWVTNPKKKITEYCDGNVCPLNTTDYYPVKCSNFLVPRCQVRVTNISACQ